MALGVLHELRRAVKAHGLAVEQGGQKAGRLVVFEPAAHVHQQGKAGGVALGKAIFAKAFNLVKDVFSKFGGVAVLEHAAHQTVIELVHAALALPGGHGAAQAVGLAG